MPYIIKNGKTYTGNSVTLTQAQYNALSEEEKNNGITYYIYDSDAVLDASDVGLGAGSVETLAGSVAVIETSPATASHAVGSYIVWNGQLYSVIAPIDVGESLTVGSNITAKSVGSELTSLKSDLTWKLAGTKTGNGAVTIPSGWKEAWLLSVAKVSGGEQYFRFTNYIINGIGNSYLRNSYYDVSNAVEFSVTTYLNGNNVQIYQILRGSSDITNDSKLYVYYR